MHLTQIQNKRLVVSPSKPSSLIRWGFFIFPTTHLETSSSGKYYWVVLEGNLIFSLIPVFVYWGNADRDKKNYKVVRNSLLGGYPRKVFSLFSDFYFFQNLPNFFSFFLKIQGCNSSEKITGLERRI